MGEVIRLPEPAPGQPFHEWLAEVNAKNEARKLTLYSLYGSLQWIASTDADFISDANFRERVKRIVSEANAQMESVG